MWSEDDIRFMREAHSLAESAEGRTTPDPMVGAVLVKGGRIVSMGYHGEVTTPHAEAWAIQKAEKEAKGATLYVNLEPCSHFGNNPPCAKLIADAGIKEVIVSMRDPNPLVRGKGFRILKRAGVKVRVGLLEEEAKRLNEVFIKYITTKMPFVAIKAAMTIDGKIATKTGASRWVAGKASRRYAHHMRNNYDAILVGLNTVLVDNPKLTVRLVKKIKNPIRIVLDAYARTPLKADVLGNGARTIIIVGPRAPKKKIDALRKKGAEILSIRTKKARIDMKALMRKLAKMQITSVLVEGGGEVVASAIEAGVADKAYFFLAPKIFGGRDAKTGVEGEGVRFPSQAVWLRNVHIEHLEENMLVTGYLQK
ncbi:MAG: bifunctional diaminohydroxyphosphoribosylaminopyrimidine deaminase/5-amino-6-(5-phosphoribosylamino)uracil reductase RibD [Candidatus Margulisiibacteriota bacterium]|nr:bifunctional diaminohydroxyphosphoribosylaminopyrimidine deaminase/5-amino-6-(5-phosphoribosylamino)uracil reductase RibD [Candidatus Margulisiibacteriota bacterium]